jgi:adenylate cyclase
MSKKISVSKRSIVACMRWQGQTTIEDSGSRIRNIDATRRVIDIKAGRVEPDIEKMALGEAREFRLAVLHIDVNDFKTLVADLPNDKKLRWMSVFLTEMTQLVVDYDGVIDRYVGDQVTALFGIGQDEGLACQHCLDCALSMQTIIKYAMNPFLKSIGLPQFTCSVGMTFGDVWIARVGTRGNNQFTLVGNAVLIAAQILEYAGKGQIFLGEFLYDSIYKTDQEYCTELTHPNFSWSVTRDGNYEHKYRFFRYNGSWQDYPR